MRSKPELLADSYLPTGRSAEGVSRLPRISESGPRPSDAAPRCPRKSPSTLAEKKHQWQPAWFAILLIFAGPKLVAAQTWIEWPRESGGNGHFYALTPCATNWAAAEALAHSWGGTLAVINSSKEQDFINQTFLTGRFDHLPVWIGLVRARTNLTMGVRIQRALVDLGVVNAARDSPFKWVTGESFSYANWEAGEPNNSAPGESYTAMNWHFSKNPPEDIKGGWNDAPLNGTKGYGGTTDGPYFGLVERDPAKAFASRMRPLKIAALLTVGLVICVMVWRRQRRHASRALSV